MLKISGYLRAFSKKIRNCRNSSKIGKAKSDIPSEFFDRLFVSSIVQYYLIAAPLCTNELPYLVEKRTRINFRVSSVHEPNTSQSQPRPTSQAEANLESSLNVKIFPFLSFMATENQLFIKIVHRNYLTGDI